MTACRKTRVWAAVTIALAMTALTGCAQQYTPSGQSLNAVTVTTPDGKTVTCVVAGSGGVSCDWEGAR